MDFTYETLELFAYAPGVRTNPRDQFFGWITWDDANAEVIDDRAPFNLSITTDSGCFSATCDGGDIGGNDAPLVLDYSVNTPFGLVTPLTRIPGALFDPYNHSLRQNGYHDLGNDAFGSAYYVRSYQAQFSQQANGNADTYALRDLQIFARDSPPALYGPGDDLNTSPNLSNVPIGQDNVLIHRYWQEAQQYDLLSFYVTGTLVTAEVSPGEAPPGSTPINPILPEISCLIDVPSGGISFCFATPIRGWYDPPMASGFEYELIGGSGAFSEVQLPPGFLNLQLLVDGNIVDADFDYGERFIFAPGVTNFSLLGLSPLVDSANPTAFPTYLEFTGTPGELRMTPIVETAAVPEPATVVMLALGLLGVGWGRRRHH